MKPIFSYVIITMFLVQSSLLGGCAATAIALGAAAGTVALLAERRASGTVFEDQSIELKALGALMREGEPGQTGHINVTSYNNAVLLTGEVRTEQARQRAAEVASTIKGVTRVYNELRISAPSSLLTRSSDSYLTSKVKTKLFGARETVPTHIKVVTENGVVYLFGLVKAHEADEAIEIARTTGGVQRVVNLLQHLPS